jgi:hypothetical protein
MDKGMKKDTAINLMEHFRKEEENKENLLGKEKMVIMFIKVHLIKKTSFKDKER